MKKNTPYTIPIVSGGNVIKVKVVRETKRVTYFKVQYQRGTFSMPYSDFRDWIYIVGVKPADLKPVKPKTKKK